MRILHRKNSSVVRSLIVVIGGGALVTLLGFVTINSRNLGQQTRGGGEAKVVTFKETLAPIFKEKCTPCHFEGGKVFDRLPFDRYETVRKLGKKLNTRLKDGDADLVTRWIKYGSPEQLNGEGKKK